jgi:hypothetical protein
MSESIKLQQEAIYEMLVTEVSYIRQILTMTDIFMTSVMILKSSQRDGLLNDIDMEKLFSNIQDVLNANLLFWKDILLPIKTKLEQTGCAMNPSNLKHGFLKVSIFFFFHQKNVNHRRKRRKTVALLRMSSVRLVLLLFSLGVSTYAFIAMFSS